MNIKVENIKKGYGGAKNYTQVLNGLSLEIEAGKMCVILGPSGSGKSTLLNVLGGIDNVDSGKVIMDNQDIVNYSPKQLSLYRREKLGFIFQFYNLVPNLTLEENVMVGRELSKDPLDLEELLEILDLTECRKKFPSQLSGGQQQRCSIARGIIKKPKLLLCDEPTGALDYKNSKEILQLLETINEKYGMTIVIVTHNDAIKDMVHQVIKIRDGKVEENSMNASRVLAKDIEW